MNVDLSKKKDEQPMEGPPKPVVPEPIERNPLSTPIADEVFNAIQVSEEDLILFFKTCIMEDDQNKPFTKTYDIKGPGGMFTSITLRTRFSEESTKIIQRLTQASNIHGVDIVREMNDLNLAYSLVSMGDKLYDTGTIEERLARIEAMPSPKKAILWDYMSMFDGLVEKMRIKHVNF